jgi:hypothetical protein
MAVKGRIGNTSPNRSPNTQAPGGGRRTVRVLRALDPFTFKTLQRPGNLPSIPETQKPTVTKNQVTQAGQRLLGGPRRSVRRLFRRDPYNLWSSTAPPPFGTGATQATFSPEAERVDTLNPNKAFHPERVGGSVRVMRQPQAAAGRRNRGNVVAPNRFTLFGGKRLRRR